jgi:thiol-disulfide isomerase/thioredoxin
MVPVRLMALALALAACAPLPAEPTAGPPPAPAPAAPAGPAAAPSWPLLVAAPDLDGAVLGAAPGQATIAIVFASWCEHCRTAIAEVAPLRDRADARLVGINFRHHEEYDDRGDAATVRAYLAGAAPWLQVVPAGDALWRALGGPTRVPTIYVFDEAGGLRAVYDRRHRPMPGAAELGALLDGI